MGVLLPSGTLGSLHDGIFTREFRSGFSCDAFGCGAVDEIGSSVGVLCLFSNVGEDFMELDV